MEWWYYEKPTQIKILLFDSFLCWKRISILLKLINCRDSLANISFYAWSSSPKANTWKCTFSDLAVFTKCMFHSSKLSQSLHTTTGAPVGKSGSSRTTALISIWSTQIMSPKKCTSLTKTEIGRMKVFITTLFLWKRLTMKPTGMMNSLPTTSDLQNTNII